jgi:hypothetical protein
LLRPKTRRNNEIAGVAVQNARGTNFAQKEGGQTMRFSTKQIAVIALLLCATAYAYRPAPSVPQEVVIEGYIEALPVSTGTTLPATGTMIVDSVKVYVVADTVIKSDVGYLKLSSLRVGNKVSVYGYITKTGVTARTIYVLGR